MYYREPYRPSSVRYVVGADLIHLNNVKSHDDIRFYCKAGFIFIQEQNDKFALCSEW